MEAMIAVLVIIIAVSIHRMKGAAEKQQARQVQMQQQEQTRMTTHYEPAPVTQKPMHLATAEGVEFHPPVFHGEVKQEPPRVSGSMEKKPLEKADLGAERAKQNAHTAANANWKAPQDEEKPVEKQPQRKPMFTPKQLRDAFIMQEILDEPVSRRKGIRRGYGS